jgi:phospholipid/cholesterol/gamma-HCH transport system substrate-binding protein
VELPVNRPRFPRAPGRTRGASLLTAFLALGIGLAGCGGGGAPARTATAYFTDANEIAVGAQVQLANIPVGHITSVALAGNRAKVTMVLNADVKVPVDVVAALSRTTILGERFIELEAPPHNSASTAGEARLPDGGTIAKTIVLPDVEQLIGAGAQVFGAVSATALSQIIAAGGAGFSGQAASLRTLLNGLSAVTSGYAQHTADIQTTINSLNQLSTSLAGSSQANAQALTNLSQTVAILAQQSSRFNDLLLALNNVSVQGRSLLESYFPQITDQLHAVAAVAAQLAAHQQDLAGLLTELPNHNASLAAVVRANYVQIFENLIVCGLPTAVQGGTTTPAFTCAAGAGP